MSSDNIFEKLWRQQATITGLVLNNKRDPERVSALFQQVIDMPDQKPVDKGPLLAFESTWSTHWLRQPFVVDEHMKVDRSSNAMIPIKRLGDNIKSWFAGKVEEPRSEGKLWKNRLTRWAIDKLIIKHLGGEEKIETTLQEMFCFLANTHTIGDWYIFYIRDAKGILRSVDAIWNSETVSGWLIDANEMDLPAGYHPKMCFVSRCPQA